MTDERQKPSDKLPEWYPQWAREFGDLYFSGTTSMFALHGNTHDLVRGEKTVIEMDGPLSNNVRVPAFVTLDQFVAGELFGKWDLVLYYDLSTGLRVVAGTDRRRQQKMAQLASRKIGDLKSIGKDPSAVLHVLDRFIHKNVMASKDDQVSVAIILNHASFIARRGDRTLKASTHIVTLLNWASSPYIKRLNTAFVLIDSALGDVSKRLVNNPHTASLDIPMPEEGHRLSYLQALVGRRDVASFSDYSVESLAELTAGISLVDLRVLVNGSIEAGRRLDAERFRELKKTLIERQAGGLLEFIEPKWGLDMVVGHEAAKQRLREDGQLLQEGKLQSVPMGYLLCGPVGTGKSFLATCSAGTFGVPCVVLKNFRGGLVGETEGNLERVLHVLRSMGPVVVVVDEADAQLGQRKSSGDSGTSSRVFGMIAQQMGDTQYRGKIVWVLLTTRPDYLPIDLKRQGRAEIHIPLFYPTEMAELEQMFEVLARKIGAKMDPSLKEKFPDIPEDKRGQISGADIEGMVGRAWRQAQIDGDDVVTFDTLARVIDGFIPMAQSYERELQRVAAIIECTDQVFLPKHIRDEVLRQGRPKIQERLNQLKAVVDG
jgi:AAA+ superfamily predicted ATPase